jgi:hypothetical protein
MWRSDQPEEVPPAKIRCVNVHVVVHTIVEILGSAEKLLYG